jgi:hypothetical protein
MALCDLLITEMLIPTVRVNCSFAYTKLGISAKLAALNPLDCTSTTGLH